MISFKGRHHQQDIILQWVRWYVANSLSYRDLEELMHERGYIVDHSTIQRWVVHYTPRIEKVFRKNKKGTGLRWRMDETYIKIKGQWPSRSIMPISFGDTTNRKRQRIRTCSMAWAWRTSRFPSEQETHRWP